MLTHGETLVLASNNKGKLAEFHVLLAPLGLKLVPVGDFTHTEPDETGDTFVSNALIKARAAVVASGLPSLADDSGLSIPALNGRPGVDTKPFADSCGGFDEAAQRLLAELGMTDTPATFTCCLLLMQPDFTYQFVEGTCHGKLIHPDNAGNGAHKGFGFDPHFIPDGYTETFATLGMDIKNQISHRADAMRKFLALLQGPAETTSTDAKLLEPRRLAKSGGAALTTQQAEALK